MTLTYAVGLAMASPLLVLRVLVGCGSHLCDPYMWMWVWWVWEQKGVGDIRE